MSGEREPWIAVKVGVPDSGKVIDLPSDAARWGLIVLWSRAKKQTPSGVFSSERVVRTLLGQYARHYRTYVANGFLHLAPVVCSDGRCQGSYASLKAGQVSVHSWHDHQRDHALRQLDYRVGSVTKDELGDKSPVREGVYCLSSEDVTEGGPGETHDDPVSAYYALTLRFPNERVTVWLNDLGQRHGDPRAAAMLVTCYSESRDLATLISRVQSRLRSEDHLAGQREKADEVVRNKAKRAPVTALQREMRAAVDARYGPEEVYVPTAKATA